MTPREKEQRDELRQVDRAFAKLKRDSKMPKLVMLDRKQFNRLKKLALLGLSWEMDQATKMEHLERCEREFAKLKKWKP